LAKPFFMKKLPLYLLALFTLFGLTNCTDHSPEPDPEPVQQSGFKGCRLIKILRTNNGRKPADDSYVEYTYDDNNNIVKETYYYTNGTLIDYATYDYDAQGKITSSKTYDPNFPIFPNSDNRTDYQYNSTGMLLSKKGYSLNPSTGLYTPIEEFKYHYDARGKVDSSTIWHPYNGNMKLYWLYTYQYDIKGNLSKVFRFEAKANGTFEPGNGEEFRNYDNFKRPESLKSFTLRQLEPIWYSTMNNALVADIITNDPYYPDPHKNFTYTYRPDSLVLERKHIEINHSEIYFYECR
jgi:hypothetical protein